MNQRLKLQLAGYMDDGMDYSNSVEVRKIVDELQEGFSINDVFNQALWIVFLASAMGITRLVSRQLVFGVGRQVEVELRQRLFDHMLTQEP